MIKVIRVGASDDVTDRTVLGNAPRLKSYLQKNGYQIKNKNLEIFFNFEIF